MAPRELAGENRFLLSVNNLKSRLGRAAFLRFAPVDLQLLPHALAGLHIRLGFHGSLLFDLVRQGSDHDPLDHGSDKYESLEHGTLFSLSTKISISARQAQCCEFQRNFCNASVVSFGFSSSTQCPVFFSTMTVASVATSLACCPSASPNDLSPPMVSTGMVNLVCES
jgi:hypothetical protein